MSSTANFIPCHPTSIHNATYRSVERPPHLSALGDKRREVVYEELLSGIQSSRSCGINQIVTKAYRRTAVTRWLKNDGFTDAAVLDLVTTNSMLRNREADFLKDKHVLVLSDGSNLDCRGSAGRIANNKNDLGVLNNNQTPGMITHASLAVDATSGYTYGLCDLIFYNRPKREKKEQSHRNQSSNNPLGVEQKESYTWNMGADNSARLLAACGCERMTSVFDAGADSLELIDYLVDKHRKADKSAWHGVDESRTCVAQQDFLVRVQHHRRSLRVVEQSDGTMSFWLNGTNDPGAIPAGVNKSLSQCLAMQPYGKIKRKVYLRGYNFINKRKKRRKRRARNALVAGRHLRINYLDARGIIHQLRVVQVAEDKAGLSKQDQGSALDWVLITSIGVEKEEDLWIIVDYYRKRWHIEQLFRTLKKMGLGQDRVQLGSTSALIRLIAIAMEVAAKVLRLVQARDCDEGYPIEEEFTPEQIELLHKFNAYYSGKTEKQKNPHPPHQLSYATWVIAKLGSHHHYMKGKPGPIIIARGLQRFIEYFHWNDALE